jgi:hypothetical protein
MNGPALREEIFRLLFRFDQCDDPNLMVSIQLELEGKYEQLSCLTGKSPESLEASILDQYATWLQMRSELSPGSDETDQGMD